MNLGSTISSQIVLKQKRHFFVHFILIDLGLLNKGGKGKQQKLMSKKKTIKTPLTLRPKPKLQKRKKKEKSIKKSTLTIYLSARGP